MSILIILLCVSLIAAGTMAWFTDDADAGEAIFTAGAVEVRAEGAYVLGDKSLGNVNPGDCYVLKWRISNIGTKKIQLRTKLDFGWTNSALTNDNVYIIPAPVNEEFGYTYDWVLYQENSNEPVYAYLRGYPDGMQPDDEVELCLIVYFDGEMTNNPYQGEEFTLGGIVEAVQASNGAPSAVWGDVWNTIKREDYSFTYEYWHENWRDFDPMDVKCYEHLAPGEEDNGSQNELNKFNVVLTANFEKNSDDTIKIKFHLHNVHRTLWDKTAIIKVYVNGELHDVVEMNVINYKVNENDVDFGNSNNNTIEVNYANRGSDCYLVVDIDGNTATSKTKKMNY